MKTNRVLAVVSVAATVAALAAVPAFSQGGAAGPARYTMDASTVSGMAAMGANGSGVGSVMSMMRGGNQVAHELILRLGSPRAPTGEAKGDHFMPAGAQLGQSVPLVTPRQAPPAQTDYTGVPQAQMPQGRLLLFWGCGEHAPAGQPVVLDFSKMARGQVPPGLFAQGTSLPDAWSINTGNSRTYGDWPNDRDAKRVPANASLLGAHRIASTYAPEIAFDLTEDFMPALRPATRDMASGAVNLQWNALAKATGYYAWVMAMNPDERGQSRDMVWWSSSSTQQFAGALADWLSPAAVRKLIGEKTVMPPTQTSCAIPAEVRQAGGPMMMTNLYAYGPEQDFSYPARPANARAGWQPDWITRVRFRANAMVMHGMPGMDGSDAGSEDGAQTTDEPASSLPRCKGLSGIAKRAAGLCI